jgi:hypothetical protein
MPIAKARAVAPFRIVAGSIAKRNPGNGSEPMALSTIIFNGKGFRSANGVESKLSKKIPIIWIQYGLAILSSLR